MVPPRVRRAFARIVVRRVLVDGNVRAFGSEAIGVRVRRGLRTAVAWSPGRDFAVSAVQGVDVGSQRPLGPDALDSPSEHACVCEPLLERELLRRSRLFPAWNEGKEQLIRLAR
eukprot:1968171-Rhodomonas_salina.1